jgi:hypothetical protein
VLGFFCLQSVFSFLFDSEIFQFVYCSVFSTYALTYNNLKFPHIRSAIDMEPPQQSEGATKDPRSPLWQYVEIVGKALGGGSYKWRCSECNNIKNGSYTRVKGHLTTLANRRVTIYLGPNDADDKPGSGLSPAKLQFYASLQDVAYRRHAKGKVPVQGSTSKPPIPSRLAVVTNKRSTLGPFEATFNNQGREVVDEHVARCIYANALAFNLVLSPYWQQMIEAVNEALKGYKSPGYEKFCTTLLTSEKQSVDRWLQSIQDTCIEKGVFIVFDGWRDQRNQPLINVIAICPQGAMFLKA